MLLAGAEAKSHELMMRIEVSLLLLLICEYLVAIGLWVVPKTADTTVSFHGTVSYLPTEL